MPDQQLLSMNDTSKIRIEQCLSAKQSDYGNEEVFSSSLAHDALLLTSQDILCVPHSLLSNPLKTAEQCEQMVRHIELLGNGSCSATEITKIGAILKTLDYCLGQSFSSRGSARSKVAIDTILEPLRNPSDVESSCWQSVQSCL